MLITHSNYPEDELVAMSPLSQEGQRIKEELQTKIRHLIAQEKQQQAETQQRRQVIKAVGKDLMLLGNKRFFAKRNEFYIGPDVENKSIIFITGHKSNLPIDQMEKDGRRSRLRRPRVKREYKNSTSINNIIDQNKYDNSNNPFTI